MAYVIGLLVAAVTLGLMINVTGWRRWGVDSPAGSFADLPNVAPALGGSAHAAALTSPVEDRGQGRAAA